MHDPLPYSVRMRAALVVLVSLVACGGSRGTIPNPEPNTAFVTEKVAVYGSRGTIPNPEPNTAFVTEKVAVYFSTTGGLHRIGLDGSGDRLVFGAPGMSVEDVSDDLRLFAWNDSDTNMYVGDAVSGQVRRVPAADGRASNAAFSPDGRTLAVSRHCDFSLPQSQWTDDDTLYLVDVATLEVTTLPPVSSSWPTHLAWSTDGKWIELGMAFDKPTEWVAAETRARAPAPAVTPEMRRPRWRRASAGCEAKLETDRWQTEIHIAEPGKPPRALVTEVGRKRGFHDYQPDFDNPVLTPSCANVVFGFQGALWVANVASGRKGPLVQGTFFMFAPPEATRQGPPPM